MDDAELVNMISSEHDRAGHPIVVGISGYCGSGKSTLARRMAGQLPGAQRVRGDDFLDPARSHLRSSDWDGVDRKRLVAELLSPVREGRSGTFRRYDWSARNLGSPEPVPDAQILIVDVIGLFHPEALGAIDLAVWCDVDLETSAHRGMARDTALGREFADLWRDVWIPNERDFDERFAPRARADVVYTAER